MDEKDREFIEALFVKQSEQLQQQIALHTPQIKKSRSVKNGI